jgi:hypothetical protein
LEVSSVTINGMADINAMGWDQSRLCDSCAGRFLDLRADSIRNKLSRYLRDGLLYRARPLLLLANTCLGKGRLR